MSTTTPNLHLTLPTGAEKVSRQVINSNSSIIDSAVGAIKTTYYAYVTTSVSLSANSYNTITLDTPATYSQIFAIIPCGYGLSNSSYYTTERLVFTGAPDISDHTLRVFAVGSETRQYNIRCLYIYTV